MDHEIWMRRFLCMFCPRAFYVQRNLQTHIQSVHLKNNLPADMFRCNICSKNYSHLDSLKKHTKIMHCIRKSDSSSDAIRRNSSCLFCSKVYSSSSCLNRHMNEKQHIANSNATPIYMVVIPISELCTEVMIPSSLPPMKDCRVLLEKLPDKVTRETTSEAKPPKLSAGMEPTSYDGSSNMELTSDDDGPPRSLTDLRNMCTVYM